MFDDLIDGIMKRDDIDDNEKIRLSKEAVEKKQNELKLKCVKRQLLLTRIQFVCMFLTYVVIPISVATAYVFDKASDFNVYLTLACCVVNYPILKSTLSDWKRLNDEYVIAMLKC